MSDKVTLTNAQRSELIEQFVELVVDNMDTKTLVQYVTDDLTDCYDKCSDNELKEFVDNYDEELFDELVNNVTNEIAPSKVTITDDNYGDKVDTFVDNMVASDDNVFTHDSEGC